MGFQWALSDATHPITLERKGAHAIGRSMGWTESWTLSDN